MCCIHLPGSSRLEISRDYLLFLLFNRLLVECWLRGCHPRWLKAGRRLRKLHIFSCCGLLSVLNFLLLCSLLCLGSTWLECSDFINIHMRWVFHSFSLWFLAYIDRWRLSLVVRCLHLYLRQVNRRHDYILLLSGLNFLFSDLCKCANFFWLLFDVNRWDVNCLVILEIYTFVAGVFQSLSSIFGFKRLCLCPCCIILIHLFNQCLDCREVIGTFQKFRNLSGIFLSVSSDQVCLAPSWFLEHYSCK